jgi:hypothetical protein
MNARAPLRLEEILREKKSDIRDRWVRLILETYPSDAKRFLAKQKDPFANPVGTTISGEIEHIYEELLDGLDPDRIAPYLDGIIRIRAVQDFTPSQAMAFVFLLKKVIRSELENEIREGLLSDELLEFEARIDRLALLAFDIYMKCREKLYEIRANEAKNHVSSLLRRTGLVCEIPGGMGSEKKATETKAK